jgi:hypothetical protein
MSTGPTPERQPDYAAENAAKIAAESLNHYDQASDTYHCSYGPPIPAVTVHDAERDLLVRIDPATRQVVGFTIPNFRAWHAAHADEDGSFEVELPPVWTAGEGQETPADD